MAQCTQMCTDFKVLITFSLIKCSKILICKHNVYLHGNVWKNQQSLINKRKYYKLMMHLTNIEWPTINREREIQSAKRHSRICLSISSSWAFELNIKPKYLVQPMYMYSKTLLSNVKMKQNKSFFLGRNASHTDFTVLNIMPLHNYAKVETDI